MQKPWYDTIPPAFVMGRASLCCAKKQKLNARACRIRSGPKKFAPQFSSCHWCCSRSLSKRFCNAHATPARYAPSCDATSRSQSPSPSPSSAFSSPACFRPFPFCRGPLAFPTLCWRFYSRVRTTFRLQLMWGWRRH